MRFKDRRKPLHQQIVSGRTDKTRHGLPELPQLRPSGQPGPYTCRHDASHAFPFPRCSTFAACARARRARLAGRGPPWARSNTGTFLSPTVQAIS